MAEQLPESVTLVNGSLPWDGHTQILRMYQSGLEALGIKSRWYQCVDPSTDIRVPPSQVRVNGWRVPPGGQFEQGVNRLLPVFARRLRQVEGPVVHVNDVYLARLAAYRRDVVVNVADLSKRTTRFYPRSASMIHDYNLRFLQRCLGVVVISDFTGREVASLLKLPAERIRRVTPYSTVRRTSSARSSPPAPTPGQPWRLLYVATDRPHKNLATFFQILADLGPSFEGVLVARVSSRTLHRVQNLGLGPRLRILSNMDDLTEVYDAAHILVHPSYYEGFGLPLIEAMSRGLPVVASRSTAVPEVVGDGGALLDPSDPATWVSWIRQRVSAGDYADWSRRAWERSATFSVERTTRELREAYAALVP